jgi:pyrrolysine biosynthesis protein PylD
VPVTLENGVIGNFSCSLKAITQYFGFENFVTGTYDVSGYYEAVQNDAEIILMADDNNFSCPQPEKWKNGQYTPSSQGNSP